MSEQVKKHVDWLEKLTELDRMNFLSLSRLNTVEEVLARMKPGEYKERLAFQLLLNKGEQLLDKVEEQAPKDNYPRVKTRIVKSFDELPDRVFFQGETFSLRVLEHDHRELQKKILSLETKVDLLDRIRLSDNEYFTEMQKESMRRAHNELPDDEQRHHLSLLWEECLRLRGLLR